MTHMAWHKGEDTGDIVDVLKSGEYTNLSVDISYHGLKGTFTDFFVVYDPKDKPIEITTEDLEWNIWIDYDGIYPFVEEIRLDHIVKPKPVATTHVEYTDKEQYNAVGITEKYFKDNSCFAVIIYKDAGIVAAYDWVPCFTNNVKSIRIYPL